MIKEYKGMKIEISDEMISDFKRVCGLDSEKEIEAILEEIYQERLKEKE